MSRCPRCKHVLGPEDCDQPGDVCFDCAHPRKPNPHEAAARAKKVMALVSAIDRNALQQGINPFEDAGRIQMASWSWGPEHWELIAQLANVNPPSPITRDAVREVYVARAKQPVQRQEAS